MKKEHREILDKIEEYLEQPGAEHLRFWQAMRNCNLIEFKEVKVHNDSQWNEFIPVDDYNIADEKLLKRIEDV
ncbi:MAG: hypothetical protein ACJAVA_000207 [Flavobacteriaceae bacterium]|jgi:hypothetical protein